MVTVVLSLRGLVNHLCFSVMSISSCNSVQTTKAVARLLVTTHYVINPNKQPLFRGKLEEDIHRFTATVFPKPFQ